MTLEFHEANEEFTQKGKISLIHLLGDVLDSTKAVIHTESTCKQTHIDIHVHVLCAMSSGESLVCSSADRNFCTQIQKHGFEPWPKLMCYVLDTQGWRGRGVTPIKKGHGCLSEILN